MILHGPWHRYSEGMNRRHWITGFGLLLLLGSSYLGMRWAKNAAQGTPTPLLGLRRSKKSPTPPVRERKVDEKPIQTAVHLNSLAVFAEEQPFARQALRLANHDVDLAYANAVRELTLDPPPLTPEQKELLVLKEKAQAEVEADQLAVDRLNRALAAATKDEQKESLANQLEVAKAELELDKDERDAAAENLERSGGDPQAKIKRLKAAHEASNTLAPTVPESSTVAPSPLAPRPGSLIAEFREWRRLQAQLKELAQAHQDALDKVQRINKRRDTLQAKLVAEKEQKSAAKEKAAGMSKEGGSRADAKAAMKELKRHIDGQRSLADVGQRIQDEQELAEVYEDWGTLIQGHTRFALSRVFAKVMAVLGVVLMVFLLNRLLERAGAPKEGERIRNATSVIIGKIALQFAGLVAIVLIALGVPGQITTVLGLAGAGLTVALKDFIVAFFGWFVLMGRNGIRVGDWVEIKGVCGEVVEIGLLRTVLLETGNWSDAAHPTGRRVAFVNSFAIEGHFFNFSTSGQWMWDELKVLVPPGEDPYPIMDGVQKLVEKETIANAQVAEEEWKKTHARYRVKAFSVMPSLNVAPTANGIEIHARYITQANQRQEIRQSLSKAVVELLHGRKAEARPAEAPEA